MSCFRGLLWCTLLLAISSRSAAAELGVVEALLKQEIVGPVLPLAELQRYCQTRMPRIGQADSAAAWQEEAARLRAAVLERVVFRGEATRWRDAQTKVEWMETIPGGPGYRIRKLRFEALPGMWIPALLYEPERMEGKVPVVLNVNGHVGPVGNAYVPKQMRAINQAKRGMLALSVEWMGMGQLSGQGYNHFRMNQLDLCGTSGLAPFYLSMKRSLDILLSHEHADPQRVAVTGLSGGGWQTIFLSALDTRVTLCNPVAGYSSLLTRTEHLKDLGDSEQVPTDLATLVDYTHLTAMMAPRPTLLTFNSKDDCCFESGYALGPLLDAAKPMFRLYGKQSALRFHVNDDPGNHNYERDNREAFYRMLGDFFYAGNQPFDAKEIGSAGEIKTLDQLRVELPAQNEDLHSLALKLSQGLPRVPPPADDTKAATAEQRAKLRALVHAKDFDVAAVESGREKKDALTVTFWRLKLGSEWTIPVVELVEGSPAKTALVLADGGRAATGAEAARLLGSGYRVLALDPSGFGESAIKESKLLFPLMIAALGERPLGLEASQVAAGARWASKHFGTGAVSLVASGPRSTTVALVAAALEETAIGQLELEGAVTSVKHPVVENLTLEQMPELFCFGLLESFEMAQVDALVAPRPVKRSGK